MKLCTLSIVVAVALSSGCYRPSAANPVSKMEVDAALDPDMGEDVSENAPLGPNAAYLGGRGGGGGRVVVVVGDAALWRSVGGLDRLDRLDRLPLRSLLERSAAVDPQEPGVSVYRRNTMRCMVGRVYRPCWD